jgi:hypothetical protein
MQLGPLVYRWDYRCVADFGGVGDTYKNMIDFYLSRTTNSAASSEAALSNGNILGCVFTQVTPCGATAGRCCNAQSSHAANLRKLYLIFP